jgi:hypothetical protein
MILEETQSLTPTVFPFPVRIYGRMLHLSMYCWALCALRNRTQGGPCWMPESQGRHAGGSFVVLP